MPNFKDNKYFNANSSEVFDRLFSPGTPAPASGIYRCESCGYEASSTAGNPLPPAKICTQHSTAWRCVPGPVTWRLVAAAIHVSAS
jgi:hypothetical protein